MTVEQIADVQTSDHLHVFRRDPPRHAESGPARQAPVVLGVVGPQPLGCRAQRQSSEQRNQFRRRLNFELRFQIAGTDDAEIVVGLHDRRRSFQVVGHRQIIVVEKDQQRSPCLSDALQPRVGQAELILADMQVMRMPRQIPAVGQAFSARVVDEQELPGPRVKRLRLERVKHALQIALVRIMRADDDGDGWLVHSLRHQGSRAAASSDRRA